MCARQLESIIEQHKLEHIELKRQHDEELRRCRGLSGTKLISDSYHKGTERVTNRFHKHVVHTIVFSIHVPSDPSTRSPQGCSEIFRIPIVERIEGVRLLYVAGSGSDTVQCWICVEDTV